MEIPADLYRGLLHALPTATWREAFRSRPELRARLRGFRPETVPVRELDRLVLKALEEDVPLCDWAVERFREENVGLVDSLAALGPEAVLERLDSLLREETAARVFWAAASAANGLERVREAVLARVRDARLPEGAAVVPPRVEKPAKRKRSEKAGKDAAGGLAEPAAAGPGAKEHAELVERLRRAEREIERARADRDRVAARAHNLEAEVERLEVERARLARALEQARAQAERDPAEPERGRGHAQDDRNAEARDRLAAALEDAEHRAAQAVQRSRRLKRELDAALERLEYFESQEVRPAYPKEPAGVSPRAPEEKIAWPAGEHHYPRRLEPFLERIARAVWVDRIAIRDFVDSAETRIKSIDKQGNIFLQYSDGVKAVRLYLTTVAKTENEGLWIAERLREIVPALG